MTKYLIASDLHGRKQAIEALLAAFAREKADKLLLLGDLLSHGHTASRAESAGLLNQLAPQILACRGNCDTEEDQALLAFSLTETRRLLTLQGRILFATHGHLWSEAAPPLLPDGFVLLTGHTHLPALKDHGRYLYLNPGSAGQPRGNSTASYLLLDSASGGFFWKTLAGEIYREYWLEQR